MDFLFVQIKKKSTVKKNRTKGLEKGKQGGVVERKTQMGGNHTLKKEHVQGQDGDPDMQRLSSFQNILI